MQMEILFKKSGISNPPDACIRDTESDANIQQEEMLTFFSNECSICISS